MGAAQKIYVPKIEVIDPIQAVGRRRSATSSARRIGFHKPSGSTPPPVPQPSDKAGMVWGLDMRAGVSFSSGINVSQVNDASGGGRHSVFAAGKEGEYQASYASTGQPALKLLATTVGTFSTDNLIAIGSDHGYFALIHNVTEGGTWYHVFFTFRTAAALSNQSLSVTNDTNYGTFSAILPNASTIGNVAATTTLTASPSAVIYNYNGGVIADPTSYAMRVNNSPATLTALGGGAGNSGNGNYINSYANTGAPDFPATNSYLLGVWLYDSPISSTEADTIFKPFAQSYGMTQA